MTEWSKDLVLYRMTRANETLEEYDFSKGIRGKYAKRYAEGTNVVLIDPDVTDFFPDHDTVNDALRSLIRIIEKRQDRFAEQADGH